MPEDAGPVFTEDMFQLDKINNIYPLGQLNGGYEESTGLSQATIQLKQDVIDAEDMVTIYAPADMQLHSYAFWQFGEDPSFWTLIFTVSDKITLRIGVVSDVVQKIKDATTDTPLPTSAEFEPSVPVNFSAGDVIAYTAGTTQAHNWDIFVFDAENENQFARQERYTSDVLGMRMVTAVCPWDLYSDEMKQPYYDLLGLSAPGQTNDCGNASRDVTGTLAGQWHFNPDASTGIETSRDGAYTTPFALYLNLDSEVVVNVINATGFRLAVDNPTWIDPAEIIDEHCYELIGSMDRSVQGYLFLQLISSDEMRMSYSATGGCPDSFPEAGSKTYYR
jgi:hypothetical protein